MIRKFLFVFLYALSVNAAFGQTACPVGAAPGSPQCGPDSGTSRAAPTPPQPTGEWIKTWGAIANSSNGEAGSAVGKFSQEEAEQAALRQCAIEGASDCKVKLVYKNQCSALIASDSQSFFQASPTESRAVELAKENCEKTGASSCKVIYSECTKPVFRKY
ncbi:MULTISPECIES: DUF4189 domain-containing protein [Xanthomonas]|uniref:DUF4189 domain-containing protein n=1 Tax=Xanthomonas TaxID=338 RepID=UPI000CEE3E00|nr:DUF4189 domain-containing protein [Xanthomonas arboricola]PPT44582.1 hypothetical protein XarbCFBP8132_00850 [Xanthomonas arboricola]